MKRLILLINLFFVLINGMAAQVKVPLPTTYSKSESTVGLTSISLDYSRPSKYGRKIFGGLVPYDSLWRTGANKNSLITFGDDVNVEGIALKKGTYSIYSKPGKEAWEIYLYSEVDNLGLPKIWDTTKIVAKFRITPLIIPIVETFTLNIENISYEACTLEIKWDNVCIPIKIEVPTDQIATESIDRFIKGPMAWDHYWMAVHNKRAKKELGQALVWINTAIEKGEEEDYLWFYRQKSLIEAELFDFKAAIASASISLKQAEKLGNKEYIKLNADAISEWTDKSK